LVVGRADPDHHSPSHLLALDGVRRVLAPDNHRKRRFIRRGYVGSVI
jgi:hypothetical protein